VELVDQDKIDLYVPVNILAQTDEEKEEDKNSEFYNVTLNLVVKRKPKEMKSEKPKKTEQVVLSDEDTEYKKTLEEADKKIEEENAPIEAPK
jgi:hypothetical protein